MDCEFALVPRVLEKVFLHCPHNDTPRRKPGEGTPAMILFGG